VISAVIFGLAKPGHIGHPAARAATETAIALSALVTAVLLGAQFKNSRRLRDLLLLGALTTLAVTDLCFSVVAGLISANTIAAGTGPRLATGVVVALAFAAAALAPRRTVAANRQHPIAIAVVAATGTALAAELIDVIVGAGAVSQPGVSAAARHPVSLAVALVSTVLLLLAGGAFTSRAARGERHAGFLAAASFLLAAARLQYLALPAVPAAWVTPREGLRLGAYGLLLVVASHRYAKTRRASARAAIAAEREGIARDLHNGLAQDVAFIAAHSQRLASELGTDHPIVTAARRALVASRRTLSDLAASTAPTTAVALAGVTKELETRFEVRVDLRVDESLASGDGEDLDPSERDEVVRIARKAIAAAATHGGARQIIVELESKGHDLVLRVSDDGCGIDEGAAGSYEQSAHGMTIMRAHADSLGARLVARPSPLGGTELEVLVS
jgi:signal transduction histidine kinase